MIVLTLVIVVVNAEMLDSCDRAAIAKSSPEPMPEYQTIVMRHRLEDALLAGRTSLERDILPAYQ